MHNRYIFTTIKNMLCKKKKVWFLWCKFIGYNPILSLRFFHSTQIAKLHFRHSEMLSQDIYKHTPSKGWPVNLQFFKTLWESRRSSGTDLKHCYSEQRWNPAQTGLAGWRYAHISTNSLLSFSGKVQGTDYKMGILSVWQGIREGFSASHCATNTYTSVTR